MINILELKHVDQNKVEELQQSFELFIKAVIEYIDSYFEPEKKFYETLSVLDRQSIYFFKWEYFMNLVDESTTNNNYDVLCAINDTEKDDLLNKDQDSKEHIQSDQLWAYLLNIRPNTTPNMKLIISYVFSIPCSNAYVESSYRSARNDYYRCDLEGVHHKSSIKAFTDTTSILLPVPCASEAQKSSAVEGAFVHHGVKYGHSYVSQQCTINLRWCEKGIGAVLKDRLPHILKGNCYAHVLHNGVKHAHDVLKSDIQQAELNLKRTWTTAVDLYRIITNLMEKLEQRLNDKYFGSPKQTDLIQSELTNIIAVVTLKHQS
ncbi:unnamed protein product, partial [Rotaria magnacalcarata]